MGCLLSMSAVTVLALLFERQFNSSPSSSILTVSEESDERRYIKENRGSLSLNTRKLKDLSNNSETASYSKPLSSKKKLKQLLKSLKNVLLHHPGDKTIIINNNNNFTIVLNCRPW